MCSPSASLSANKISAPDASGARAACASSDMVQDALLLDQHRQCQALWVALDEVARRTLPPGWLVLPFGSFVQGTQLFGTPLDVALVFAGTGEDTSPSATGQDVIQTFVGVLTSETSGFRQIQAEGDVITTIPDSSAGSSSARTSGAASSASSGLNAAAGSQAPVRLLCDVSVAGEQLLKQEFFLHVGDVTIGILDKSLADMLEIHPVARQHVMAVKLWAKKHGFDAGSIVSEGGRAGAEASSGSRSSFAWTVLAVFGLQRSQLLPPMKVCDPEEFTRWVQSRRAPLQQLGMQDPDDLMCRFADLLLDYAASPAPRPLVSLWEGDFVARSAVDAQQRVMAPTPVGKVLQELRALREGMTAWQQPELIPQTPNVPTRAVETQRMPTIAEELSYAGVGSGAAESTLEALPNVPPFPEWLLLPTMPAAAAQQNAAAQASVQAAAPAATSSQQPAHPATTPTDSPQPLLLHPLLEATQAAALVPSPATTSPVSPTAPVAASPASPAAARPSKPYLTRWYVDANYVARRVEVRPAAATREGGSSSSTAGQGGGTSTEEHVVARVQLRREQGVLLGRLEWEKRFNRREKQIRLAKDTVAYRWWQDFCRSEAPVTPRAGVQTSKKDFETEYNMWRLALHRTPEEQLRRRTLLRRAFRSWAVRPSASAGPTSSGSAAAAAAAASDAEQIGNVGNQGGRRRSRLQRR